MTQMQFYTAKKTIEGYNPGGCYYDGMILNGDKSDMYERAKKCYEDRKNRGLRICLKENLI